MITNISYIPNRELQKFVDRIYVYEKLSDEVFRMPIVPPGTGLELVFHQKSIFSYKGTELPISHIVCPRTATSFDEATAVSFISVRFKSGRFRHFTDRTFLELNDTFLSVFDLWGDKAVELIERLKSASNTSEKIDLIEAFLIENLKKYYKSNTEQWDKIIDTLYYQEENISTIARENNMSIRTLQRGFKAEFGLTPKRFQKLARVQKVIKRVAVNEEQRYLDAVFDRNYTDQSHFIKEFRSLVAQRPKDYFKETSKEKGHFYHKSLKAKI